MIGGTEIFVVLLIALLVFGPSKLPEIARQIGKAMGDFRRVADETMHALQEEPPPPTRPSAQSVSREDEPPVTANEAAADAPEDDIKDRENI